MVGGSSLGLSQFESSTLHRSVSFVMVNGLKEKFVLVRKIHSSRPQGLPISTNRPKKRFVSSSVSDMPRSSSLWTPDSRLADQLLITDFVPFTDPAALGSSIDLNIAHMGIKMICF